MKKKLLGMMESEERLIIYNATPTFWTLLHTNAMIGAGLVVDWKFDS